MATKSITSVDDNGPLITYTVFTSITAREKTEYSDAPWTDLVRMLADPPTYLTKRDCPLLSLCEYGDATGDGGGLRHAANVRRVYGIEVDYDGEEVSVEEGEKRLHAAGLAALIYTSASYTDGAPRWRAILPLSEPAAPIDRAKFVARANRALGGIASRESFTLSQSFYFGKVRGAKYIVRETRGRCIDQAVDLEPLFHQSAGTDPKSGRDTRSNQQLIEAFGRGEGRYEAMLKLSSRWAARGMEYDDVVAALEDLLASSGSSLNADGIDLRSRVKPMAASAVRKFAGTVIEARIGASVPEVPEDLPPFNVNDWMDVPEAQGMVRVREPEVAAMTPSGIVGSGLALGPRTFSLRRIGEIVSERREATWLIHNVIEANVLAVLAGPRASFKSFIALDWAMRIAVAGNPVVVLSGEGAGLGRRAEAWMQEFGKGQTLDDINMLALEQVANLNSDDELAMLVEAIDVEGLRPALVVVDTLSKFSAGMDENSNQEVAEYLSRLTRGLRERYQASILIVAHSGHGDAKRPRGASALMANPDAEYIVQRPDATGMMVTVSRERFKDTASLSPLAYEAVEIDLGRADKYGERVKSLVMRQTDAAPTKAEAQAPTGKSQRTILNALRERQKRADSELIWTVEELRSIGRECGLNRYTVHDAVEKLMLSPFLTATVGGSKLAKV